LAGLSVPPSYYRLPFLHGRTRIASSFTA
jgi:hypothetical protein